MLIVATSCSPGPCPWYAGLVTGLLMLVASWMPGLLGLAGVMLWLRLHRRGEPPQRVAIEVVKPPPPPSF